ncbi:MAG: HDOD domain-containing protein [Verrucomicrobia bacterium]|nr:HDOD domain-containing protein [Verrucomicrobiota bacterium]
MSPIKESQTRAALADATLARVRSGIEEGQVPVISQIVRIIREISEKADSMSVQDLADIISQDPTTMQRIVSIAGTLGYNPGGAEITSILQAIGLVGFERIRNLAISVMLLENVEQQCGAETNKELAGLSLSSGLVAAGLCGRGAGVEPDLAFLCGALRTYGRMLMATFMNEEYSKAMASIGATGSGDGPFLELFGLSPLDLVRELLSGMQLPPMILKTLQEIPEETRSSLNGSPTGSLMLVADLGLRIADVLATQPLDPDDFERKISEITKGYPEAYQMTSAEAGGLVRDVATKISGFQHAGKYNSGRVVLFERIECLAEGRTPPAPFHPKERTPASSPNSHETPRQTPGKPEPRTQAELLKFAREEIERVLKAPRPDLEGVFELLLRTMQAAFDLRSCLIFTRETGTASFGLRSGVGPLASGAGARLRIQAGQRDVFGVPLTRGEDVLIQDPNEPRMRAFVPEWLRRPGECLPFMLLPLKDAQGTFSLVCAVCRTSQSFAVLSQAHDDLHLLRAALSALGPILRERQP